MIEPIKSWLAKDWQVNLSHVWRECNHVADRLAAKGHELPLGLHIFNSSSGLS